MLQSRDKVLLKDPNITENRKTEKVPKVLLIRSIEK